MTVAVPGRQPRGRTRQIYRGTTADCDVRLLAKPLRHPPKFLQSARALKASVHEVSRVRDTHEDTGGCRAPGKVRDSPMRRRFSSRCY